jgi:hypothetical protein
LKDCASRHSNAHAPTLWRARMSAFLFSVLCTYRTRVELNWSVTSTIKCQGSILELYLWGVSFMPRSLYPPYPFDRRLIWFQNRSVSMSKKRTPAPAANRALVVQSALYRNLSNILIMWPEQFGVTVTHSSYNREFPATLRFLVLSVTLFWRLLG